MTNNKTQDNFTSKLKNKQLNHTKPETDEEFGHYLAGLIDGDGYISKGQIKICFNILDLPLAEYIVSRLGCGIIYKIKDKNAYSLQFHKYSEKKKILDLINGKLRGTIKINQVTKLLNYPLFITRFPDLIDYKFNYSTDLNNFWLSGFSDADSSFQIKMINRKNRRNNTEIRLSYQIDQKTAYLLEIIKSFLGGNIGHRKKNDTYYYSSTSFIKAHNVINYFDKFNLLSSKYLNYLKWKEAYLVIQAKEHLELSGIDKIKGLKNSMNNFSKETFDLLTKIDIIEIDNDTDLDLDLDLDEDTDIHTDK